MTKNKITSFIIVVIFKGWSAMQFLLTVGLSLVAIFLTDFTTWQIISAICAIIVLVFSAKIIKQFYNYFLNFHKPLKVIRKVQGDGIYKGIDLIVLENDNNYRDGLLMTLYCKSSGARQPVCLLELLDTTTDSEIVATVRYLYQQEEGIDKYFNEESRRKSLFAVPMINSKESEISKL